MSAARAGPEAWSSSRTRLRTGWAMARSTRGSLSGWGSTMPPPYPNCARTIAQHYLRNIWCGHARLPTALAQPRLHRALDRRHRQRARQRAVDVRLPPHRLRPQRLGAHRRPGRGRLPRRPVRHAAAGRRARRPRRPQADHARLQRHRLRGVHLARGRGGDRQPHAPPPRRGRAGRGRGGRRVQPRSALGDPVGRRHRRPADRPQPEPGPPARRLAARRAARGRVVRRHAVAAVRRRRDHLRGRVRDGEPGAHRPVSAAPAAREPLRRQLAEGFRFIWGARSSAR